MKIFKYVFFILLPLQLLAQDKDVGIFEHIGQTLPSNIKFTDENYNEVNLKDLIKKPTIISLVYYRCPGLCSPLLNGIAEVIDKCQLEPGKDYQVITVSFNPEDTPDLAREKKDNELKAMHRHVKPEDWKWLVGDTTNINKLTRALGFMYKKEGKEYMHGAAIYVVSGQAKISRYLYGTYFLPVDLKMALTDAKNNTTSASIPAILKYCYSYDPAGRKYILNINRITGSLVVLFVIFFFLFLVIRKKPNKISNV